MGEIVQQCLEELLAVFEQLQRVQLFTPKEIGLVVRKCKAHEYRLQKPEKSKEDFIAYAQYLINFLALVRKRRKQMRYWFKKDEIDKAICRKTEMVFRTACHRFQNDVKLWLSRIEFAKSRKATETVSKLYLRLLQVHTAKPKLWVLAAKWEFEENGSADGARTLLHRALRFNATSEKLWLELFRMELMFIDKIVERRKILGINESKVEQEDVAGSSEQQQSPADAADETASDAILDGQLALVVFNEALKTIPGDVRFCLKFLPIAKEFTFASARKLVGQIFEFLSESFVDSEEAWKALAERCLDAREGEGTAHSAVENALTLFSASESSAVELDQRESACDAVYEKGIARLNTDKLWTFYIDCVLQRYQNALSSNNTDRMFKEKKKLLDLLQRALDAMQKPDERLFLLLTELSDDLKRFTERSKVLFKGVSNTHHPASQPLWLELLRLAIEMKQPPKAVKKLFNDAVQKIPEKLAFPLWELALTWSAAVEPGNVVSLIESGLKLDSEISCPLKEFYLQWISETAPQLVESTFRRLATMQPNSIGFYLKFVEAEKQKPSPNVCLIRFAYEFAVREHGDDRPDLWLEYCQFEGEFPSAKPENVDAIYHRAVKQLRAEESDAFVQNFALARCGRKQ